MEYILKNAGACDVDLIYEWANDYEVRRNSFNTQQIVYEQHLRWFERLLSDPMRRLYLCVAEDEPVGSIRLDVEGTEAEISYMVANGHRGQGIGTIMLEMIKEQCTIDYPDVELLKGFVKAENIASQKAFLHAGYSEADNEDSLEFVYRL